MFNPRFRFLSPGRESRPWKASTASLVQGLKRQGDSAVSGSDRTSDTVTGVGNGTLPLLTVVASATVVVSLPEILIGATLVEKGGKVADGDIVIAVTPVFRRFLRELATDPDALYKLDSRQFEELIAGAYEE